MNVERYCAAVERLDLIRKRRCRSIPIVEDNSRLVSLQDSGFRLIFEPSVKKDYRYLVRELVFEKIGRMSKRLEDEEKVLLVRSTWRSFSHQRMLWDARVMNLHKEYPEVHPKQIREMAKYFIAPEAESMHATGGAVDALIYDLKHDRVMDFGTNDGTKISLGRKCYPLHPGITPQAKRNRQELIGHFEKEGFVCDIKEYWHFDFGNVAWAVAKREPRAMYGIIKGETP